MKLSLIVSVLLALTPHDGVAIDISPGVVNRTAIRHRRDETLYGFEVMNVEPQTNSHYEAHMIYDPVAQGECTNVNDCYIHKILITNQKDPVWCPDGYYLVPKSITLNGDLNQAVGGADIFLCVSYMKDPPYKFKKWHSYFERYYKDNSGLSSDTPLTGSESVAPDYIENHIYGLRLQESSNCGGNGWHRVDQIGSNGDLNQGAGGKWIFLCFTRNPAENPKPLHLIYLREQEPDVGSRPTIVGNLNGDLNQGSGGKYIFLELYRDPPNRSNCAVKVSYYNIKDVDDPGVSTSARFTVSEGTNQNGPSDADPDISWRTFPEMIINNNEVSKSDHPYPGGTYIVPFLNPTPSIVVQYTEEDTLSADDYGIMEFQDICTTNSKSVREVTWVSSDATFEISFLKR